MDINKKGEFMENLDYIEWLIGQAKGFILKGDQLIFPEGGIETFDEHLISLRVWELVWFPLLLVMAHDASILEPIKTDKNRNYWLKQLYMDRTGREA